ncbi:uncharacterized protein RB166_019196 [Leptodactylus fuscus]
MNRERETETCNHLSTYSGLQQGVLTINFEIRLVQSSLKKLALNSVSKPYLLTLNSQEQVLKSYNMKWFPAIFSCALLVMTIIPAMTKILTEEERQRAMKRDIELGLLAIEPPVKDDVAVAFDQDIKMPQAEEDRDHLYHAQQHAERDFPREQLRMQARAIHRGPEEDRDHLYHQH